MTMLTPGVSIVIEVIKLTSITQDDKRKYLDGYFKEHQVETETITNRNSMTTHAVAITLVEVEGGVYIGYSKVDDTYYAWFFDFVNREAHFEGITGKALVTNFSNFNKILGYGRYTGNKQLKELYKLGKIVGAENNGEQMNVVRGVMRVLSYYPVLEQIKDAQFFERMSSYDSDICRYFVRYLSRVYADSKATNVRNCFGWSKHVYRKWLGIKYISEAFSAVKNPTGFVEFSKFIERARSVLNKVDQERGYHNADEYLDDIRGSEQNDYMNNFNSRGSFFTVVGLISSNIDETTNLLRYLYASCYHQQALSYFDAMNTLADYYSMINRNKAYVKFPRYLKTAHDIAAANAATLSDGKYSQGVRLAYNRYHKQFEGQYKQFTMLLAATPEEIADEANQQGNCVAGYISSVAEGIDLILFMRQSADPDTSWVTVELRKDPENVWHVVQSYATYNQPLSKEQFTYLCLWAKGKDIIVDGRNIGGYNEDLYKHARAVKPQEAVAARVIIDDDDEQALGTVSTPAARIA